MMRHTPLPTLELTFCPTCGRDDRWTRLKARHFSHGALCPGQIVRVVYQNPVLVTP